MPGQIQIAGVIFAITSAFLLFFETVLSSHQRWTTFNWTGVGFSDEKATCAKNAQVQIEGGRTVTRTFEFYNLDVIISVCYRVKSMRGTQFRIWANSVLKDYLIKSYAVRNDLAQQKYDDLKQLVEVMGRAMNYLEAPDSPAGEQIKSIFDLVKDYTNGHDGQSGCKPDQWRQ